jgi:hypothetical protein
VPQEEPETRICVQVNYLGTIPRNISEGQEETGRQKHNGCRTELTPLWEIEILCHSGPLRSHADCLEIITQSIEANFHLQLVKNCTRSSDSLLI